MVHSQVFVYGTLKRGYSNFERYLAVAEKHGNARLISGTARTLRKFPMVLRPKTMPPATCGPVMMESTEDSSEAGHQIIGEVFEVTAAGLEALDILEGVTKGHYYRRIIDVEAQIGHSVTLSCIAYFYPSLPELLALSPYKSIYSSTDHDLYTPGPINQEILSLCQKPTHGLVSKGIHPMRVVVIRLLPGEDLLDALLHLVASRGLPAATICSAVGSTATTVLRPAGLPTVRVFDGKFEVVSLTGTLGVRGHHLHMSISDANCQVFGGHVMRGCIVRTTLEVVLGVIDGLEFTRPNDVRTGYDELSINEVNATADRSYSDSQGDINATIAKQ